MGDSKVPLKVRTDPTETDLRQQRSEPMVPRRHTEELNLYKRWEGRGMCAEELHIWELVRR